MNYVNYFFTKIKEKKKLRKEIESLIIELTLLIDILSKAKIYKETKSNEVLDMYVFKVCKSKNLYQLKLLKKNLLEMISIQNSKIEELKSI